MFWDWLIWGVNISISPSLFFNSTRICQIRFWKYTNSFPLPNNLPSDAQPTITVTAFKWHQTQLVIKWWAVSFAITTGLEYLSIITREKIQRQDVVRPWIPRRTKMKAWSVSVISILSNIVYKKGTFHWCCDQICDLQCHCSQSQQLQNKGVKSMIL